MRAPAEAGDACASAWPSLPALNQAVRARVTRLLDEHDGVVATVARIPLSAGHGILSDEPHSLTCTVVTGACVAAGGDWRRAAWAAVAGECLMAAADLLDDVADGELDAYTPRFGAAVVLTAAGGLLSLATEAAARTTEDGVAEEDVAHLARLLGSGFAVATEGQSQSLLAESERVTDPVHAHQLAASKSGPLGALLSRLGARCGTSDPAVVALCGTYGWHLAVRNQLLNDARDAGVHGSPLKRDVREGRPTVPLVFAGCAGAPSGLDPTGLAEWEAQERQRIVERGGVEVALALAEAERLHAAQALDELASRGRPVEGLHKLLG